MPIKQESPSSPKVDPREIYPDAVNDIPSPSQALAVAVSNAQAKESNRLVSMRAKSVLVAGVLIALSATSVIFTSLGKENGTIMAIIGFIGLLAAGVILFSKNQHTVSLIIRIFLAFQLVGLFMSLINPVSFLINAAIVILLTIAYFSARKLSY